MADNTLDGISTVAGGSQGRNAIIFVADGLRPSSVNPEDAPTLYELSQKGVKFVNSHSLFPTFTTPNASAIAQGADAKGVSQLGITWEIAVTL